MKVGASVRPICEYCQVIIRRGTIKSGGWHKLKKPIRRVICKRNPRHKQRQG